MAEHKVLDFFASKTQSRFILSEKFYNIYCGPRGEGKSTSGLMRILNRALLPEHKPYLPLKWACVRDTRKNIGLTTARTIHEWFPKPYSVWRGKPEEPEQATLYLENRPVVIFDFFGVNSPADHDRFQSYEASGGVWIEEPAPAATNTEMISSGVAESVLAVAVTSIRGAPFPSVQLTLNPPAADHWVAQLFHLPGYEAAGDGEYEMSPEQQEARAHLRENSAVFMAAPGENRALDLKTPGYRERNRMILMATGRSDLLARLSEGRVGYAQVGERVTPEFGAHHLSPGLQVIPSVPLYLCFDYGLNPTCLVTQVSPNGYWLIHRVFSRTNVGMKQLLERDVQPYLAALPTHQWTYCGGPEAVQREQSDSEESALRTIFHTLGLATYHRGPVSWHARAEALHDGLTRHIAGLPWIRIHPDGASRLVRALDGGWAYPTDAMGRPRRDQPDKRSHHDHVGDAFAHGCATLLRKTDAQGRSGPTKPHPATPPRVPYSRYARGGSGTERRGA